MRALGALVVTVALLSGCSLLPSPPEAAPSEPPASAEPSVTPTELKTPVQLEALLAMDFSFVWGVWISNRYDEPHRLPVVTVAQGRLFVEGSSIIPNFTDEEYALYSDGTTECLEARVEAESTEGRVEVTRHGVRGSAPSAGPCPDSYVATGRIELPTTPELGPVAAFYVFPHEGTCFTEATSPWPFPSVEVAWYVEPCDGRDGQLEILGWGVPDVEHYEPSLLLEKAIAHCTAIEKQRDDGRMLNELIPPDVYWSHNLRHFLCLAPSVAPPQNSAA